MWLIVSTHCPLHDICPLGHVHCPALQDSPPLHCRPQLPQWLLFVRVSTHMLLQTSAPCGHMHCPPSQLCPVALHCRPQFPQFFTSPVVSTHMLLQNC
jgi:hypothetical protein